MTNLPNIFWRKKTVISPFTFQKSLKKQTKTLSKRSYVLKMILRTRRKQCRQFSRKKIWTKTNNFWMNVQKWCEKNFLTKFFHNNLVWLTNRKQYWQRDRQISVEMTENVRSMPNAEIEKELSPKKILCKKSHWTRGKPFWQRCRLFSEKSLDCFAQGTQMINETNKDLSKRFSFVKLIPWTRKRQCRQLGRKQFEQRLINLRSMSVIYGDKKLDETFFTTNRSNRQTESSTDIGTDKILSKWHTKVAQCPMMKKRTFSKKYSSKNLLGYVVSKFDKFADCFFDEKTVISPFNFGRKWKKKNKQKLCQNKIMSSNWSFGLVKWSSVKFTEKVSKKIDNFLLKVRK